MKCLWNKQNPFLNLFETVLYRVVGNGFKPFLTKISQRVAFGKLTYEGI